MVEDWEGVEAALGRFGLPANPCDRDELIRLLRQELQREEDEEGDQFLMRLVCAQLFSIGLVEDTLIIWEAKSCCFDTLLSIDVQFLCGAGLDRTKDFLRELNTDSALEALDYVKKCEAGGDFTGFSVEQQLAETKEFYRVLEPRAAPEQPRE
jgi:hypothetical protein